MAQSRGENLVSQDARLNAEKDFHAASNGLLVEDERSASSLKGPKLFCPRKRAGEKLQESEMRKKRRDNLEFDFSPPPKSEAEKLRELIELLEQFKSEGKKINEEALEEDKRKLKELEGK